MPLCRDQGRQLSCHGPRPEDTKADAVMPATAAEEPGPPDSVDEDGVMAVDFFWPAEFHAVRQP